MQSRKKEESMDEKPKYLKPLMEGFVLGLALIALVVTVVFLLIATGS